MGWTAEDRLTMACVRWFTLQHSGRFIMHIANERNTKRKVAGKWITTNEGAKLKKMGVRKGVADLFIAEPVSQYAGLWIELKVQKPDGSKTYPSPEQRSFLSEMNDRGYAVAVAWGADQFIKYVNDYFSGVTIECEYLVTNNHIEL